jgi:hypothetical protein
VYNLYDFIYVNNKKLSKFDSFDFGPLVFCKRARFGVEISKNRQKNSFVMLIAVLNLLFEMLLTIEFSSSKVGGDDCIYDSF